MKKILKSFLIIFLFIICSFWVFAQTRQFWMTTVINNGSYSGSLGFFEPNPTNSNSEPKMILTNSGLVLQGDLTFKKNASAGKVLVSLDTNGNANWADSMCPAGFALRGFGNNGQKECTELPFGIYRYPNFIRDHLVRESSVSVNFHAGHFFYPVISSTDSSTYTDVPGAWRMFKNGTSFYAPRNDSDPNVDFCSLVGPAGFVTTKPSPWADGIITSSMQWICRGEFADKGKTNFEEKGWIPAYYCESYACQNNAPGDNTNKRLRYRKTYYGCNVNTCRNIKNQICDPNTSLVTTVDKCKK